MAGLLGSAALETIKAHATMRSVTAGLQLCVYWVLSLSASAGATNHCSGGSCRDPKAGRSGTEKDTVKTFQGGNPDNAVTGIAVTMIGDDGGSAADRAGGGPRFRS